MQYFMSKLEGQGIKIKKKMKCKFDFSGGAFVCVEVLRPSQPNGVLSSTVSLPSHTFTGQA